MATDPTKMPEFNIHDWAENRMRALATEIARDILPLDQILKNHAVSENEWARLTNSKSFKDMLAQAVITWNTDLNTKERVELKSLFLLEQSLETAQTFINDKTETSAARVEMLKFVSKLAGFGDKVQGAQVGTAIQINIDKGNGRPTTVEVLPQQVTEIDT